VSHAATAWAFNLRGLTPGQKVVLLHLADCHSVEKGCFPSQQWLADACEISERTLREYLNALEGLGLIIRERKTGNQGQRVGTRYYFAYEVAAKPLPADVAARGPETAGLPATDAPYRQSTAEPTGNCLPVITSNYNKHTTAPAREEVSHNEEGAFVERVKAAIGEALADPATTPNLAVTGPVMGLLSIDPPCAVSDVIDAARYVGAYYLNRYGPRSLKTWRVLLEKAVECRNGRLAGYRIPPPATKPQGEGLGDPARFDADTWRKVIDLSNFRKGAWKLEWGPPPGTEGSRVPGDLVELWKGTSTP